MSARWRNRIGWSLVIASAASALLVATGVVYQWLAERREAGRYAAPGSFVNIGGRRLHLLCIGEAEPGAPVVIFEPSEFGGATSSAQAQLEIATRANVCSYDRAGTGWSDSGPAVASAGIFVSDVKALLERAAIPPPYLIVSSSIGGLTTELFARQHREDVAGLLFLDAQNSENLDQAARLVTETNMRIACSAV